jgi:hypothetical protein
MHYAAFNADKLSVKYKVVDSEFGDEFDFQSTFTGYEEKQVVTFLQIPAMAQYQGYVGQKMFYVAGGLKVAVPLISGYSYSSSKLVNTGTYSEENIVYDDLPFRGFGTFKGKNDDGDLNLKVAVLLALEGGMKFSINNALSLYLGVYVDYGVNNLRKSNGQRFVEYFEIPEKNSADYTVNSITQPAGSGSFTDKINPVAIGLKVALTF